MRLGSEILLVGEIFVDFSLPIANSEVKLRLGGIVHAARGLWAIDANFSVAAICPSYLVDQARDYLKHHGCSNFIWLAEVKGSPNVMMIGDPTELADQGYNDILREMKSVEYRDNAESLKEFKNCLIFPGSFSLSVLKELLAEDVRVNFDIAYDIADVQMLDNFKGNLHSIIISTSSPMFLMNASLELSGLIEKLRVLLPHNFLLKENRGGSRVFDANFDCIDEVPALLGDTVNSVGVGDVYSAVFVYLATSGLKNAAWTGGRAATCYAQTTYPDDFKRDVQRSLALSVAEMRGLSGTILPWHSRQKFQIYFAAPDFSYVKRKHIDEALEVLSYHNFHFRRPIQENGELMLDSDFHDMRTAYLGDVAMLDECDLVFALPLDRDPGTLVEIGLALSAGKPVVTYDPLHQNSNTMVVAGSTVYSTNLDKCLNGVFESLSKIRTAAR